MAALSLFVGLMVPAELRRRAADAIAEGGVLLGGLFFLMTPSPVARLGLLHFSLLHPALASVRARVRVSPNPDPDSSPHPHLSPLTSHPSPDPSPDPDPDPDPDSDPDPDPNQVRALEALQGAASILDAARGAAGVPRADPDPDPNPDPNPYP
eukprot:scaffold25200_cov30-Phaeocystis_antarctica.AAC.1